MTAAFSVSNVRKQYSHFTLQGIDLTLPEGTIMGLVGVNGAGKTTLLRILMGLARPDEGEVAVLGLAMPEHQVAAKRDIGFASEDMRLYPSRSLSWHMALMRAIYPQWDDAYAAELLKRFDLNADQLMQGCSHGQRVKAMLLLNLARRPRLLLLDEPTTGLDPVARAEVLEALAEVLRDERRSVLFSSHNTHDIEQLSDSIAFLHGGKLLAHRDKESFVDDWRRILCQGTWPTADANFPEITMARQNGSVVELKVRGYSDDLLVRLRAKGLEISSVNPMSLEDIFITTVRAGAAA